MGNKQINTKQTKQQKTSGNNRRQAKSKENKQIHKTNKIN